MNITWTSFGDAPDDGDDFWVLRGEDETGRPVEASIPYDTVEWRSVEYGIPLSDREKLMEIVIQEIEDSFLEADGQSVPAPVNPYAMTPEKALEAKEKILSKHKSLPRQGVTKTGLVNAVKEKTPGAKVRPTIALSAEAARLAEDDVEARRILDRAVGLVRQGMAPAEAKEIARKTRESRSQGSGDIVGTIQIGR